jgi:hypothetical protein
VLALVGGDEFNPGNEEQDRVLAAEAGPEPAFVVPTAAARQDPQASVQHATAWFKQFGLGLRELPVLKRTDANSKELADLARTGGFFYLVGGDPGLVAQVLRSSRVWSAIFAAWMDSAEHSAFTGDEAMVVNKVGGEHRAAGGYIQGRTLELNEGARIVQSWRTTEFPPESPDSRVEITLEPTMGGTW